MFGRSQDYKRELIKEIIVSKSLDNRPPTDRELLLTILHKLDRVEEMLCELGNMEKIE